MKQKKSLLSLLAGALALLMTVSLANNIQIEQVHAATSAELADQLEELESKNDEINAELEELRGHLQENTDSMEEMVAQKDLVDQEIALLYEQMELTNTQISAYSLLIADKQAELDEAQLRLQELQRQNKMRIRAMEENGKLSYWSVLSQANSFMDMLDRLEMVQEIAKADEESLQELKLAAQEVAAAKEAMTAEQEELQGKRDALNAVETELAAKREQTDKLLIEIKEKYDEYATMIEESERLQEDLMQQIASKNDELEDARYQEWLATSVPETAAPDSGSSSGGTVNEAGGKTWLTPCSYNRLSSPFGYRWHPISGNWKMHNGVDLTGSSGTPIRATRAGYVAIAAYQAGGAGNYVSLNHGDGYKSIYMHMTHYIVSVGEYVNAGQVIGYMGTTGGSTGVHLHFGISYNGVYVNPANYVNLG